MNLNLFKLKVACMLLILFSIRNYSVAQNTDSITTSSEIKQKKKAVIKFKNWYDNQKEEGLSINNKQDKKWYESFAIRGYAQLDTTGY
jgi:hypothetical protein